MHRISLALLFCLALTAPVAAGDVATFKNLGFSTDSRYLQFAQYGIDGKSQNPYADIFTVDLPRNDFVKNGNLQGRYSSGVSLGDDGQKALFDLMTKASLLRMKYRLDYLNMGRPIYFRIVSENAPSDYDNIKVLDYKSGNEFTAVLKKSITTAGGVTESSFWIELDIRNPEGKLIGSYKVGNPKIVRKGVQNYTVVQMILAPNDRALVFVVEKDEADGQGGSNLRYMVETLTF